MVSKQGRQEARIDPAEGPLAVFAIELRQLRKECGSPAYRELATWSAKVGSAYSDTTFSIAARGQTQPSLPVVLAYVQACLTYAKADEQRITRELAAWTSRWEALEEALAPAPPAGCDETGDRPQLPQAGLPPGEADVSGGQPVRRPVAHHVRGRRGVMAILGGVAVLAGLGFGVRYIGAPGSATAESGPQAGPSEEASLPAAAPPAAPSPTPGIGDNSRCARLRYVSGLAWSPCTQVDTKKLDFAVWLSNPGKKPVIVKIKMAYVQAGTAYACPGRWGTGVQVEIAPGATMTSPEKVCAADKLPATAFQAKAWVIAPDEASWGYREMSQTVHVQADGVTAVWADEA
ncbi:hypothetical protein ACIRQF_07060 [Streptomyces sp. NPDC101191]|uniref:hypothetical protein n=1 Tax=Streptomyces sp. NPDC101191 TaxID=3366126 RepID=UPI0038195DC2